MTDEKTSRDDAKRERPYEADYGDATPEQVALALLRYRPKRKESREKE